MQLGWQGILARQVDITASPVVLTIAEDFSQYAAVAPTFFYFVGSTAPGVDPKTAPANHSPTFLLDEAALQVGVRTMLQLSLDRLAR